MKHVLSLLGVYRYLYWMLVMKKDFSEVPSPLFTFVNGEKDDDDGDVDDQPFSPFWEWILFGTKDEDYDNVSTGYIGESGVKDESKNQPTSCKELTQSELANCWNQLNEYDEVSRALKRKGFKGPEELLVHLKLVELLLDMDGEPF